MRKCIRCGEEMKEGCTIKVEGGGYGIVCRQGGKNGMRWKRFILSALILALLIGSTVLGIYLKRVADYQKAVRETTVSEIPLSAIPDGVYIGEYDAQFIYAKVKVTMANGRIMDIDILEHKQERGKPAEAITSRICKEQRIDVDAVSGATNSSMVIKKAIENALRSEAISP